MCAKEKVAALITIEVVCDALHFETWQNVCCCCDGTVQSPIFFFSLTCVKVMYNQKTATLRQVTDAVPSLFSTKSSVSKVSNTKTLCSGMKADNITSKILLYSNILQFVESNMLNICI